MLIAAKFDKREKKARFKKKIKKIKTEINNKKEEKKTDNMCPRRVCKKNMLALRKFS